MHTGYLQLDRCVSKVGSVHCGALLSTRYQFAPITVTTRNDSRHWQMSPGGTNPFPGTSPIYETMKNMWLPSQGYKPQSIFPQAASLATPVVPEGRTVMRWSRGFICVSCTCNSFLLTIESVSLVLRPLPQMWCMTGAMNKGLKSW